MSRHRCEAFGDGGGVGDGIARAGSRDGHEQLWKFGEEEAAEQRAARLTRTKLPGGDQARSRPEAEAGQGAWSAAAPDRRLVPEPPCAVEGEATRAPLRHSQTRVRCHF